MAFKKVWIWNDSIGDWVRLRLRDVKAGDVFSTANSEQPRDLVVARASKDATRNAESGFWEVISTSVWQAEESAVGE